MVVIKMEMFRILKDAYFKTFSMKALQKNICVYVYYPQTYSLGKLLIAKEIVPDILIVPCTLEMFLFFLLLEMFLNSINIAKQLC